MIVGANIGFGVWLLAVAALVYVAPSIVAENRKAPNRRSIYAINFLLGWTLIGWVAALAMALRDAPDPAPKHPPAQPRHVDDIARLADLHERGALTDVEFAAAKRRLLDG